MLIAKLQWENKNIYVQNVLSLECPVFSLFVWQLIEATFLVLLSDSQSALVQVAEADIHAVAGLLKMYLRDLPEPLFTDDHYPQFVEANSRFSFKLFFFTDNHCFPKAASLSALSWVGGKSCYNLGPKMLRILHFLTRRTSILQFWYLSDPFPLPTLVNVVQSGAEIIQQDFNIVWGWRGEYLWLPVLSRAFSWN